MRCEAHLQNIVSWAVPRYIESCNHQPNARKLLWAGYVPSNRRQNAADPAALAMDFLMLLDCKFAVALELKYLSFVEAVPQELKRRG